MIFPFKGCLCTSNVSGKSRRNWMIQGEKYLHSLNLSDGIVWIMSVMGETLFPDRAGIWNVSSLLHEWGCESQPLTLCMYVYACAGMHMARSSQVVHGSRKHRMLAKPRTDLYLVLIRQQEIKNICLDPFCYQVIQITIWNLERNSAHYTYYFFVEDN